MNVTTHFHLVMGLRMHILCIFVFTTWITSPSYINYVDI